MKKWVIIATAIVVVSANSVVSATHWTTLTQWQKWDGTLEPVAAIAPTNPRLIRPERVPPSHFFALKKERLLGALGEGETLVLPPQVQENGVSQALRGVFGESVIAMVEANGESVPATTFELQSVLSASRRIRVDDVERLREQTKVNRVLQPYVGYVHAQEDNLLMLVSFEDYVRAPNGEWTYRVSKPVQLALDPMKSPFDVFEQALAQHADWLGYEKLDRQTRRAHGAALLPFWWDPAQSKATLLQQVGYLQLLGTLTPKETSKERSAFFARSLVLLRELSNTKGSLDGLFARAYRELNLIALAKSTTKRRVKPPCYQSLLYENLTELTTCATNVTSIEKPILLLEAMRVAVTREQDTTQYQQLVSEVFATTPGWLPYVNTYIQPQGYWDTLNLAWMKEELDQHHPVAGYSMENVLALATKNDSDIYDMTLIAPLRHFSFLIDRTPGAFLGKKSNEVAADRLILMQAIAMTGFYRHTFKTIALQARPEVGMRFIEKIEGSFSGHPLVAYLRAEAHFRLSRKAVDTTSEYHARQAFEFASRATFWSDGRTYASRACLELRKQGRPKNTKVPHPWNGDFPSSLGLMSEYKRMQQPFVHNVPTTSIYKKAVVDRLSRNKPLGELAFYYLDHPIRTQVYIEHHVQQRDWEKAIPLLESAIQDDPTNFELYQALGNIYLKQGEFEKAARQYSHYPPFVHIEDQDQLKYGNEAYQVAMNLETLGRTDLARPFLDINLNYPSGSGSNYMSAIRVALLDKDFASAGAYATYMTQRYPGADSYASQFGLVSIFGGAEQTLTMFDNYVGAQENMIAWIPALVAQRILGWEESEVLEWLDRDNLLDIRRPVNARLIHYVRSITTDREVTQLDKAFVRSIARPNLSCGGAQMWLNASDLKPGVSMASFNHGDAVECFNPIEKATISGSVNLSEIELYLTMRNLAEADNFHEAHKIFKTQYADNYGYREHSLTNIARILMESDDVETLDLLLERTPSKRWLMQHELVSAIRFGYDGEHATALHHLRQARGFHLGTGNRWAISPYQIAETIFWLWEKSGHEGYRQMALEFARNRSNQYLGYAWPFALVALLTDEERERAEFAAKAAYLDRNSKWLEMLSTREQTRAHETVAQENPFLIMLKKNAEETPS